MKTIGYKDIAGGGIIVYVNKEYPTQKRHDRIKEALKDLDHTACIKVYLLEVKFYTDKYGRKAAKIRRYKPLYKRSYGDKQTIF